MRWSAPLFDVLGKQETANNVTIHQNYSVNSCGVSMKIYFMLKQSIFNYSKILKWKGYYLSLQS